MEAQTLRGGTALVGDLDLGAESIRGSNDIGGTDADPEGGAGCVGGGGVGEEEEEEGGGVGEERHLAWEVKMVIFTPPWSVGLACCMHAPRWAATNAR